MSTSDSSGTLRTKLADLATASDASSNVKPSKSESLPLVDILRFETRQFDVTKVRLKVNNSFSSESMLD